MTGTRLDSREQPGFGGAPGMTPPWSWPSPKHWPAGLGCSQEAFPLWAQHPQLFCSKAVEGLGQFWNHCFLLCSCNEHHISGDSSDRSLPLLSPCLQGSVCVQCKVPDSNGETALQLAHGLTGEPLHLRGLLKMTS